MAAGSLWRQGAGSSPVLRATWLPETAVPTASRMAIRRGVNCSRMDPPFGIHTASLHHRLSVPQMAQSKLQEVERLWIELSGDFAPRTANLFKISIPG